MLGKSWVLLLCTFAAFGGEWVLPWVANQTDAWGSELVFNNHGSASETLTLTAVRVGGISSTTTLVVPAGSQVARSAAALFSELGSGTGYCVFVSAETDALSCAVRLAYLGTASGFSPAMASGISTENSAQYLVFPTMPGDGFSAPTLVNLAETEASVTLRAYTDAGLLGDPVTITIPPRSPWAALAGNVFPALTSGAYLTAQSTTPIVGANFSFNAIVEPSMINARPFPVLDSAAIEPLLVALDSTAAMADIYVQTMAGWYSKTAKRACPDITTDFNLGDPEQFLHAAIDFGSGCTTPAGVYHSGSLTLDLAREGGVSGGWMTGDMAFDQFISSYQGSNAALDGTVHVEAATSSQNFFLNAALSVSGDSAVVGAAGALTVAGQLNGNLSGDVFRVYGNVTADVAALYTWLVSAQVSASDPLIYAYEACPWPTDGRLDFQVDLSGTRTQGQLDFGTGDCHTATLTMYHREETIQLGGIYE